MRSGGLFGLSYTWSKAINYVDNNDSGLTWNWVPMRGENLAVANFDRPHNLQMYGVYDLPFGRGKKCQRVSPSGWLYHRADRLYRDHFIARGTRTAFALKLFC